MISERFLSLPTTDLLLDACEHALEHPCEGALPRLVIDTNVLLDLFFWKDPGSTSLLAALEARRFDAFSSPRTLEEFAEVLSRPQFSLQNEAQRDIFRSWLALSQCVHVTSISPARCRDTDDQKFLELCVQVAPCFLVTKDKRLTRAARKLSSHSIRPILPAALPAL